MQVFVTGATGYIGGSVAAALMRDGHRVSGLVRTEARAAKARERGIDTVLGTLDDAEVLRETAHGADAVVHAADADHRASVEAMLAVLRGTGKPFIQTSGSGIVADMAGGASTTAIYDEQTQIRPLPERAARVALNEHVLRSAADGVRAIVITPPMIYGRGMGVHEDSIQVPKMIEVARRLHAGCCVGAGENRWSNVHIEDLVDLYRLALERAPAGASYYAENGENAMREIAYSVSRVLGFGGRTRSLSLEESFAEFGEAATKLSFGSNSRVRAVRARRELGWRPTRPALVEEIERGWYAVDSVR